MGFTDYLEATTKRANEEKAVIESLVSKTRLSSIEIRAVKNALQVLIENSIGKAKKILKEYNCPLTPQRSKDAVVILHEVGAISDEIYRALSAAIGFRNVLIHDYMEFDDTMVYKILKQKSYLDIYHFLIEEPHYKDVIIRRIENYIL